MSLITKLGAINKIATNKFYDFLFIGSNKILSKDMNPENMHTTMIQGIDYVYLKESLKSIKLSDGDTVLDLGSGKGRLLLYLNYFYGHKINLLGVEINKEAYIVSKKLLYNTSVKIYNVNALEDNYITDLTQ